MKNGLLLAGGIYFALQLIFFATACTNDELPPPTNPAYCDTISITTYEQGVKEIIDNSCAYSGCHDGSGGIGPGNYTDYNGILPYLNSGSILERVVNQKDDPSLGMPPNASVYLESKQDDLTQEQFEIIQCWLLQGFPER